MFLLKFIKFNEMFLFIFVFVFSLNEMYAQMSGLHLNSLEFFIKNQISLKSDKHV
jgi:hypothetical protein